MCQPPLPLALLLLPVVLAAGFGSLLPLLLPH
jgi:hypothetical protein